MLMLLSVHMTSFLFLVRFNNFTLTMGFYWSYMAKRGSVYYIARSYDNTLAQIIHSAHSCRLGMNEPDALYGTTLCLQLTGEEEHHLV